MFVYHYFLKIIINTIISVTTGTIIRENIRETNTSIAHPQHLFLSIKNNG